jgi:hypothetical protein
MPLRSGLASGPALVVGIDPVCDQKNLQKIQAKGAFLVVQLLHLVRAKAVDICLRRLHPS